MKIFRRQKSEEDLEGQFEEVHNYIAKFCLDVFDAFSEKYLRILPKLNLIISARYWSKNYKKSVEHIVLASFKNFV